MKRLREWLESIVFAGMKPSGQPVQAAAKPATWFGRQRARVDTWISGDSGHLDPLYLTNRTLSQKVKAWSVIGVPLVILVGGVAFTLSSVLEPPGGKRAADLSPAEISARILPNLKDLKIESNHNLDVLEIRVVHEGGGVKMVGVVKNLTTHEIAMAEISCDLTDAGGTQLGAVTANVEHVPASATRQFEVALKQTQAAFVLVREISTK